MSYNSKGKVLFLEKKMLLAVGSIFTLTGRVTKENGKMVKGMEKVY